MNSDITLCLTIGNRPQLLAQTLTSLLSFTEFKNIIAINDFSDKNSNDVFRYFCPEGLLLDYGKRMGHHIAVDELYKRVQTPYIFHCEDDWLFNSKPNLLGAKKLLENENINSVSFRSLIDFEFYEENKNNIRSFIYEDITYSRIDHFHKQWFGYSFNPHLIKKNFWLSVNGFQHFKKERHISRHQRKQCKFIAFIEDGYCVHIGEDDSVSWQKKEMSYFKRMRGNFKKIIGIRTI